MRRILSIHFAALALGISGPVQSSVVAYSMMEVSNLRITLVEPDPNVQLFWTDDWFGQVTAQAQRAGLPTSADNKDLLSNSGMITATASTDSATSADHLTSSATYAVTNGKYVSTPQDGTVRGRTESSVILNTQGQGDGFGLSAFNNFFTLVNTADLTDDSPVDVEVKLHYSGKLQAKLDNPYGYFDAAIFALLGLGDNTGSPILVDDDSDPDTPLVPLARTFLEDYSSIAAPPVDLTPEGMLTIPFTLSLNSIYYVYAEADSESYAAKISEPATALLLPAALPAVVRRRRTAT